MNLAFTTATCNYLAQAITVGSSYLEHNPKDKFVIFLLDKIQDRFKKEEFLPLEIVEVETNQVPHFEEMVGRYNLFELITAVKPSVSLQALKMYPDCDAYMFLDSDMLVYSSFNDVNVSIEKGTEIIISSHFFTPVPVDGKYPDEKTYFNCGIYNAGFFAFSNNVNAISFLKWWQDRLSRECILDFSSGLFYEQKWMDLIPLYFNNVEIIKHPGYNVAYWNFHERSLSQGQNNQYFINENFPLVFFHFSGYNFNEPAILSGFQNQNRYDFSNKPEFLNLFNEYNQKLESNNINQYSKLSCYFKSLTRQPAKKTLVSKVKSKLRNILE